MPYYCTVPQCTSMAGKAKNVSFHQFPRDTELADRWNLILRRGKPYTKYSKVCSLHFTMADYTVTSVGKNKGQWRTLRKDAIPSRNLPPENWLPYNKNSSVSQQPSPPRVDPQLQHHLAQAIYLQTMLAIHAANYMEKSPLGTTTQEEQNSNDASSAETPPTNPTNILSTCNLTIPKNNEKTETNWYKCSDCTKCFKDPDVLTLHKRSHNKDVNNFIKNNHEKTNLNPILANLLMKGNENLSHNADEANVGLAAHMQLLFRNVANINCETDKEDNNESLNDSSDSDRLVINESV